MMALPAPIRRFVIHEHRSSRLHYDFRLEIDGVLKSWTIPKGPSMNPADRRLAIMVPDHTLAYIDFEGIIPEGTYGAGPVIVWDAGTFVILDAVDPQTAIADGRINFELHGKKVKGSFSLVLMRELPKGTGKEWLLIKSQDGFALPYYAIKSELTPARLAQLQLREPSCTTE